MERKNLLSIGRLSKLTGVNIKSLRYYDQLGILRPAYVDRDSKYRYYTFSQVYIVEAIQLCVELDIPLKRFLEFLDDSKHQINYIRLLEFGSEIAQAKIKSIQDRLAFLEEGRRFISHAEEFSDTGFSEPYEISAADYIAMPIKGTPSMERCYEQAGEIFEMIQRQGLKSGYEIGLMTRYCGQTAAHFAFVEIDLQEGQNMNLPWLVHVPKQNYISIRTGDGDAILHAPELFWEQFSLSGDKIVMQTDLFLGVMDTAAPKYELRCSLPMDE